MAKTKAKPEQRTFTGVVYLERTVFDDYKLSCAPNRTLWSAARMHEVFRGIARWFRRPRGEQWSTKRRVELTIRILDEEEEARAVDDVTERLRRRG